MTWCPMCYGEGLRCARCKGRGRVGRLTRRELLKRAAGSWFWRLHMGTAAVPVNRAVARLYRRSA